MHSTVKLPSDALNRLYVRTQRSNESLQMFSRVSPASHLLKTLEIVRMSRCMNTAGDLPQTSSRAGRCVDDVSKRNRKQLISQVEKLVPHT